MAVCFFLRFWIAIRHLHARLFSQDFDSLYKADILCFLHKIYCIALGVTAKAVIKALLIIHMKRRGFFMVKGARRPHITLARI